MTGKGVVRVRIAPSPTGYLHLGTARTALFNWLFARKENGVFILRIEDTDRERSKPEYENDILKQMIWLGLNWDEGPEYADQSGLNADQRGKNQHESSYKGDYGPYRQSERGEIYKKYIKKLLDEQHAYCCFCTEEELEGQKQSMIANGHPPKYNGRCRNLSEEEIAINIQKGKGSVIRFKMPEINVSFTDVIRGRVTFDMSLVGDIVIAKNLEEPLYNLAAVIDDHEMRITDVIRAEDHLANTPKQIAIQKAFNFESLRYAHLPLILNPDRSKMSKRFADVAINDYARAGYLADALINFLALLGWHPKPEPDEKPGEPEEKNVEREIFSIPELIELFDLKRVQKGGAVFNEQKLDWLNSQYIKLMKPAELLNKINDFNGPPQNFPKKKLLQIVELEKERLRKLTDFKKLAHFFFELPDYEANLLIWQKTPAAKILENLKETQALLLKVASTGFTKESLLPCLMPFAEAQGRGEVLWPLRVAVSGLAASPGPFEIMAILGKDETIKRITAAIAKLETKQTQLL